MNILRLKTASASALIALAGACLPTESSAAAAGTWSDCGQVVDFDGTPKMTSRTGGPKGIRLDYLQMLKQPDLLQQAYCFPGEVTKAEDMWVLQDALAGDGRLADLQGNVASIPGGWLYVGSGIGQDANGRDLRIEFQCRSLKKHVACLSVAGPKGAFPRRTADKFFASMRPVTSAKRKPTEGEGDVAALRDAGISLDSSVLNPIDDAGKGTLWRPCVAPLLRRLASYGIGADVTGIISLRERKTDLGRQFALLVKRSEASKNLLYECELSTQGDFIGVQSTR